MLGMPDPSHQVLARVHGVAARSDDLRAAAEELANLSATQAGCLGFDVLAPPGAKAELVLLSAWRSERDMRAHFTSAAYGRYVSAVTDLLTRPSDVTIYAISGAVHPIPDLSREPQRAS
jgi:quinol monooxygenase YgiN